MKIQNKIQYIAPTLLLLVATVATTHVMATGLSYDPYENYYHDYYGIDAEEITKQAMAKIDADTPQQLDSANSTDKAQEDMSEFADPRNFYTW